MDSAVGEASSTSNSAAPTRETNSGRKRARSPSDDIDALIFGEIPDSANGDSNGVSISASGTNRPKKRARTNAGVEAPPKTAEQKQKGWSAAEEGASKRTEAEYQLKITGWTEELHKVKNAQAKRMVENAFAVNTPVQWKYKRFQEADVVPEKQRGRGRLGQDVVGRGAKIEKLNVKGITDRWHTYENDALRYAKWLNLVERFEKWGKPRKIAIRDKILGDVAAAKNEELSANGFRVN